MRKSILGLSRITAIATVLVVIASGAFSEYVLDDTLGIGRKSDGIGGLSGGLTESAGNITSLA
eukprot:m.114449 g.114449  ORF g.114449 m.114449 type:complete len:63 (+) comp37503_c0_seq2:569-757(+)